MNNIAYRAQVVRGVDAWVVYVPALQRATPAASLAEVEQRARSLIATHAGADPATIDLEAI